MSLTIVNAPLSFMSIIDPALYWYDPTTMMFYVWNGFEWVVSPNTTVSVSAPLSPTVFSYWFNPTTDILSYWNGMIWVPESINLKVSTTPTVVTETTTFENEIWYNPTTDILYLRDQSNTYWIVLKTQYEADLASLALVEPTAPYPQVPNDNVDTTITEFMEAIAFNWSGNYSYPTVTAVASITADQIAVAGNITTALQTEDLTELNGVNFTIVSFTFDATNNQTIITLNAAPTYTVPQPFIVQDIDITPWFQFTIISANPGVMLPSQSPEFVGLYANYNLILTNNSFIIPGDVTTLFSPGVVFNVIDSQYFNGTYQVVSSTYPSVLPTQVETTTVVVQGYGPTPGLVPFSAPNTAVYDGTAIVGDSSFAMTNTNNVILSPFYTPTINYDVPSITVLGNATVPVQPGSVFQIEGSPANDGLYYAIYVQYEPILNTSTIGVGATTGVPTPTLTATGGGMIVPYRFINEVMEGSFDNGGYDTEPYDQSAGSIIHMGP